MLFCLIVIAQSLCRSNFDQEKLILPPLGKITVHVHTYICAYMHTHSRSTRRWFLHGRRSHNYARSCATSRGICAIFAPDWRQQCLYVSQRTQIYGGFNEGLLCKENVFLFYFCVIADLMKVCYVKKVSFCFTFALWPF